MSVTTQRIETILTSAFSNMNFLELVNELFDSIHLVNPDGFNKELSNFSSHIEGSTHIGNCITPDNKIMIIVAVRLKAQAYVKNSRSKQRSYAKILIENAGCDAAFIAFYTEGDPKWRLSFVRLDYEMRIENGRLKAAVSLTPAKRYSYLVGEGEPCHTAIDRLRIFIDNHSYRPTIDEIEEAFSVEKVTDEFFRLYCEKFHQIREHLENNEDFVIEAEQHNFTSAQFAKKLMGQIVFLYFLQKKGWLGVNALPRKLNEKEYKDAFFARGAKSRELIPIAYRSLGDGMYNISRKGLESLDDADKAVLASCVKGEPWGTGPHNFMRKLYGISERQKANFYEDYLEPLFYNALNVNRGEQGYCAALHCRIPFLSGGLFEPIDGYEWQHNNFNLPNSLFSEQTNGNSRTGNGILDIFDRYNFTMSEDEPMEREVAIDPEMLGKVFENLLEVNDRKSKGAFYTPREIVHYMCRESLISYLTEVMNLPDLDIRDFILYGDFMKDEDTCKDKRQGSWEMYIAESLFKVDVDGNVSVNRLYDLDAALSSVRVADPAVGSGAFPLGMLNEIVRARQNITEYLIVEKKSQVKLSQEAFVSRNMHLGRSAYQLKYETIKNCIFAADIEPSAVDIAQLRLWLSLVIDDEITPDAQSPLDGHRNPLPLPNLECNILCGNSLLDELSGIRLIDNSVLLGRKKYEIDQRFLTQDIYESTLRALMDTQDELFRCDNPAKKEELKDKISGLRDEIIMSQLVGASDETKAAYEETKQMASKPYVLWQLDFARVFREKGGFDIVIGNPPYIQLQKEIDTSTGEKLGDQYEKVGFGTFAKTGDIYCLFYEKGHSLLRSKGVLIFITSNKWMRAGYGKKLRGFLAQHTNPLLLIDFAGTKVFETATVDVNILMFSKEPNSMSTTCCIARENCLNNMSVFVKQNSNIVSFAGTDIWTISSLIEQSIKQKIEAIGTPLREWDININRGILTGFNEAFIISEETKDELISVDPKSAEIIRPILRGRDIRRYGYEFADLWLISTFPSKKYDIDDYPAVKDYLLSFGISRLEQTGKAYFVDGLEIRARKKTNNKWFETQDSISYWDDFSRQKIVWGNLSLSSQFAYIEDDFFVNAPSPMIVPGNKYLLAVLNSKLGDWYIRQLGVTRNGGYFEYKPMFVEKLPVPQLSEIQQAPFNEAVDILLAAKENHSDLSPVENEINQMVYTLYHLSEREIDHIERG